MSTILYFWRLSVKKKAKSWATYGPRGQCWSPFPHPLSHTLSYTVRTQIQGQCICLLLAAPPHGELARLSWPAGLLHIHGRSHHRAPWACATPSAVHIFAAQASEVWHFLWQSLTICLSDGVRPSVTIVSHALTVKDIEICFVPYNRGLFLVSGDQILQYRKKVSIFCMHV